MRFRAQFRKDALPSLLGVISSLAKLSKLQKADDFISFMRLSHNKINISVRNVDHIEVYSEFSTLPETQTFLNLNNLSNCTSIGLQCSEIFLPEYFLESKRQNQIALSLQLQNLYEALKSGSICDEINVKLSQRDGQAVLSFEFRDPSLESILITQDCPVQPLTGDEFELTAIPEIPPCEWNIELPKTKNVLNILAHSQKIGSDIIQLKVSNVNQEKNDCEIAISSDSTLVTINTRITHCKVYPKSMEQNLVKIQRNFKTRRIQNALKVAYDSSLVSGQPKFIMLAIPNDEETDPWMCILASISSLETGLLTCVLPSQIDYN